MNKASLLLWVGAGVCFLAATLKFAPKYEIGWFGAFLVALAVILS